MSTERQHRELVDLMRTLPERVGGHFQLIEARLNELAARQDASDVMLRVLELAHRFADACAITSRLEHELAERRVKALELDRALALEREMRANAQVNLGLAEDHLEDRDKRIAELEAELAALKGGAE